MGHGPSYDSCPYVLEIIEESSGQSVRDIQDETSTSLSVTLHFTEGFIASSCACLSPECSSRHIEVSDTGKDETV